jgi:hypothetical protein
MKCGDLIIVCVGGDEGLCCIGIVEAAYAACTDTLHFQAFKIGRAILSDSGHDQWIAAEQFQVVSDIARTPTILASYAGHQKRDIDLVELISQQGFGKASVKGHDGVKRKRTANQ